MNQDLEAKSIKKWYSLLPHPAIARGGHPRAELPQRFGKTREAQCPETSGSLSGALRGARWDKVGQG